MNKKQEYILCAAVHYDDKYAYQHQPVNINTGFVLTGRRHHNCFITLKIVYSEVMFKGEMEQGFLTSYDRFVNRTEAAKIAFKAKQIDKEIDLLLSEDLY